MTTPMTPTRGRSTRGQHRRNALLDASADLLLERGISAISHRAVAARAHLPLAATTYYFASLEDLTYEALALVIRRWTDATQVLVDRLPPRLDNAAQVAAAVLEIATARPAEDSTHSASGALAMYERYVEAGRHPTLRPLVHGYNETLLQQVSVVLARGGWPHEPSTARLVLAVVDGVAIFDIAEGVAPASSATDVLTRMLGLLASDRGAGTPGG